MGVIQRMIRFQSSFTFNGMTGWIFSTFCVRLPGSIPPLKLFCTGTLMRLATGFCAAFRKASALAAAAGVSSVLAVLARKIRVPDGPCRDCPGFRPRRLSTTIVARSRGV